MEKSNIKRQALSEVPRLTLRDMIAPLFRHRLVVLLTFCSVFVAAVFVAWGWASHYYVASMQVVVDRERLDPAVTPPADCRCPGKQQGSYDGRCVL